MMKQTIKVYLTTRDDPVPDLDSVKDYKGLIKWRKIVGSHVIKSFEYESPQDGMITDLEDYVILEAYAVIAYPVGSMEQANQEIGSPLLATLRSNTEKLSWRLAETGNSDRTLEDISNEHPMLDTSSLWENFTYSLISDPALADGEFEVDLEIVVEVV